MVLTVLGNIYLWARVLVCSLKKTCSRTLDKRADLWCQLLPISCLLSTQTIPLQITVCISSSGTWGFFVSTFVQHDNVIWLRLIGPIMGQTESPKAKARVTKPICLWNTLSIWISLSICLWVTGAGTHGRNIHLQTFSSVLISEVSGVLPVRFFCCTTSDSFSHYFTKYTISWSLNVQCRWLVHTAF